MPFLPDLTSLYPGNYGFCLDKLTLSMQQRSQTWSQTCWSVFGVRRLLSFIYSVALPWSSMSHFHCWCWCHFSNASMGTGICMTPPPPPLTTNSSFNTSAKCPVPHTVLNLFHFHPSCRIMRLLLKHLTLSVLYETLIFYLILVRITLIGYVSYTATAVKTYTLWNGNDCQLNLLEMQFILWVIPCTVCV